MDFFLPLSLLGFAVLPSLALFEDIEQLLCSDCGNKGNFGPSPRCITGSPVVTDITPPDFKIGFLGDTGGSTNFHDVLTMFQEEGVQMVIHPGDLGYTQASPAEWNAVIDGVFSTSFPYLAALGNHDTASNAGWNLDQSYTTIFDRASVLGTCEGQSGANMVCTHNGVTIVLSGIDEAGSGHVRFVNYAFQQYPNRWRICVFHKNMRLMQTGDKTDEVGWGIYEACRRQGAIVITGHQHQYSRTFGMSSFDPQVVVSTAPAAEIVLNVEQPSKAGVSFATVCGLGGYGHRDLDPALASNPWWAQALGTGNPFGGLVCAFHSGNDDSRADCYFKDIGGSVKDTFVLRNNISLGEFHGVTAADAAYRYIQVQVNSSDDKAEEVISSGAMNCDSTDLELGEDLSPQLLALRFEVPFDPVWLPRLQAAYLEFHVDELNSAPCSVTIRAENSSNSAPFCQSGTHDISRRVLTTSTVAWDDIPAWVEVQNSHKSPNVVGLVREVVALDGWTNGDPITFVIQGSGKRTAFTGRTTKDPDGCSGPILVLQLAPRPPTPPTSSPIAEPTAPTVPSAPTAYPTLKPIIPTNAPTEAGTLMSAEFEFLRWSYALDEPVNPLWFSSGYDDVLWDKGYAPLGYGDGDRVTYGTVLEDRDNNGYFRHHFFLDSDIVQHLTSATMRWRSDDGANSWINGQSIFHDADPTFAGDFEDRAISGIDVRNTLQPGANVITFDIVNSASSSDIYLGDVFLSVTYVIPPPTAAPSIAPTTLTPTVPTGAPTPAPQQTPSADSHPLVNYATCPAVHFSAILPALLLSLWHLR